eukprot:1745075-Rhodomonas_salina.1
MSYDRTECVMLLGYLLRSGGMGGDREWVLCKLKRRNCIPRTTGGLCYGSASTLAPKTLANL